MPVVRNVELKLGVNFQLDDESRKRMQAARDLMDNILHESGGPTVEHKTPTLGSIVHYRGKEGVQALRAATVSCTVNELDPQNVIEGNISDLDDEMHVHLFVFTPGARGFFVEFNVPHGEVQSDGKIPPGTWCWPKMV